MKVISKIKEKLEGYTVTLVDIWLWSVLATIIAFLIMTVISIVQLAEGGYRMNLVFWIVLCFITLSLSIFGASLPSSDKTLFTIHFKNKKNHEEN